MAAQHGQLNISLSFKQVVDIVKQLSPSEKQTLSELLWMEQDIDDIVIPEEHKQIVRERIKKNMKIVLTAIFHGMTLNVKCLPANEIHGRIQPRFF